MTERGNGDRTEGARAELRREIEAEQAYLDRVYAELDNAGRRAAMVSEDGFARTRTDRTGEVREEELTGLFERDALVYRASRRQRDLQTQYEGLVFGRLDLAEDGRFEGHRETRYVGRLGVRDDDYEPLVIDWRAPAAGPFYRATPAEPLGVLRRRVLQCRGSRVIGVEDDLLVPTAPEDLVVIGDGALMAALGRSRGATMRDIVATIQAHQDEAIRASARGVTEITGGPGTGKTVVALHRAAYLLYSDRRRFEAGGVLVVGPSAAYTAYIERVLPSLGEDSVVLRSMGDLVDAVSTGRLDPPEVAAVKGSLRMRRLMARLAAAAVPGGPERLRTFVAGQPVRLEGAALDKVRAQVLRHHPRNGARAAARAALGQAAWAQVETQASVEREEFLETFADHLDVDAFLTDWWPPLDPRLVLLWLADPALGRRLGGDLLTPEESAALSASIGLARRLGVWSVADVALVDDLAHRLGPVPEQAPADREFYEIDELDDVSLHGVAELGAGGAARPQGRGAASYPAGVPGREDATTEADVRRLEALLRGRIDRPREYAHVLVDEAQDVSPMQWRMLARRGRGASWTVVGDAAQSSWPDAAEAAAARRDAFGRHEVRSFRLDVNYRNAAEIFEYAAGVILPVLPDADIPRAVRETGVRPTTLVTAPDGLVDAVADSVGALLAEVEGGVAVIAPQRWRTKLTAAQDERVLVVDPMSTKGLEYDATVVVDPDGIVAESPGGARILYVALTRAAHRMHVVRPVCDGDEGAPDGSEAVPSRHRGRLQAAPNTSPIS